MRTTTAKAWGVAALAAFAASLSGMALLAHALGWLHMPFFVTCISLPAAVFLVALTIWSRALPHRWLAQRVWAGCWMGVAATLAYDGVRLLIVLTGLYAFQPFRIIGLLGVLITGRPEADPLAVTAGWVYHFWNGINFAMMYVLALGKGKWPFAVVWAMGLEVLMLLTYPGLFNVSGWDIGFIGMSLIGHIAYGLVLGFLSQSHDFLPLPGAERRSVGSGSDREDLMGGRETP